jgi:putative spermidine/putrescine transport system substrate-binding protein
MNVMGIVAGSKNADLAYQLMDFWLSKEVQTRWRWNWSTRPSTRTCAAVTRRNSIPMADQIASLKFVKPETILKQR